MPDTPRRMINILIVGHSNLATHFIANEIDQIIDTDFEFLNENDPEVLRNFDLDEFDLIVFNLYHTGLSVELNKTILKMLTGKQKRRVMISGTDDINQLVYPEFAEFSDRNINYNIAVGSVSEEKERIQNCLREILGVPKPEQPASPRESRQGEQHG